MQERTESPVRSQSLSGGHHHGRAAVNRLAHRGRQQPVAGVPCLKPDLIGADTVDRFHLGGMDVPTLMQDQGTISNARG